MWNSHPWECSILYYIKDCYFSYLFSLISLYIQSSIALFKEPSYSVERKRAFIRCYILNIIYFQWIHIQGLVNRQTQNHLNVNLSHLVLFFFCFVILSVSSYQRKYPYNHLGRTLCQPPTRAASETQYFFVDVSTLSSQGTNYQLRVSRVESFTLQWVVSDINHTNTHTHTHVTVAAWLLSFNSIANSKVWALQ